MEKPQQLTQEDVCVDSNPLFDQRDCKASIFHLPTPPEFIDNIEQLEPLNSSKDILEDCIRRDNERAANPSCLMNRVVYDSLDPSPYQSTPSPTQPYYSLSDETDSTLIFESRFESGNLRRAIQLLDFEYDLILRWDTNSKGNMQWYYFSVSNTKKNHAYTFNIINMLKPNSLYNLGMKPCVYSEKSARFKQTGWSREGQDICYYQNSIKRASGSYYTLTFTITSVYDNDTIYLSHCYPYTYTDLCTYLDQTLNDPKKRNRIRRKPLCQTISGRTCDLLTITTFNNLAENLKHRRGVVLFGRVHPGESNASWMIKGLIDFLTGPTLHAKILRDNFIFKVVPMLNPDGVAFGNNRCGFAGVDLNRCWIDPSKKLHPTIFYAKAMLKQFTEETEVVLICDFHGHSRKKNVFMYGCTGKTKNRERVFPKLLEKISEVFSFPDCVFAMQKAKEATARIVIYKELGIVNSFTMEASFCGASLGKFADFHFNQEGFQQIGHDFCEALLDFCSPDQGKVKGIMEELELSPFEEEIAEENEESEKNRRRKRSKKPISKKRPQVRGKKECLS